MGRLLAVGNQLGTIYLVELSENLTMSNKNDKMLLTAVSIRIKMSNGFEVFIVIFRCLSGRADAKRF